MLLFLTMLAVATTASVSPVCDALCSAMSPVAAHGCCDDRGAAERSVGRPVCGHAAPMVAETAVASRGLAAPFLENTADRLSTSAEFLFSVPTGHARPPGSPPAWFPLPLRI